MGLPELKDWSGAVWIGYENIQDTLKIVPFAHGRGKLIVQKAASEDYFGPVGVNVGNYVPHLSYHDKHQKRYQGYQIQLKDSQM